MEKQTKKSKFSLIASNEEFKLYKFNSERTNIPFNVMYNKSRQKYALTLGNNIISGEMEDLNSFVWVTSVDWDVLFCFISLTIENLSKNNQKTQNHGTINE